MKLIFRVQLVIVSFVLGIGSVACSKEEKKSAAQPPQVRNNQNDNPKPRENESIDLTSIQLGQEVSAKGDVLKDENEMFSLTKAYSFKLDKETNLQIRKSFGNGNCGKASASFIVMKGEEQIGDVTIDRENQGNGVPVEKFAEPFSEGDYMLVAFITLEQECKDMMFYYDFFLEESK
jgi:hypothetical protein